MGYTWEKRYESPSVKNCLTQISSLPRYKRGQRTQTYQKSHSHKAKAKGTFGPCTPQHQPARDPHLGAGHCRPRSLSVWILGLTTGKWKQVGLLFLYLGFSFMGGGGGGMVVSFPSAACLRQWNSSVHVTFAIRPPLVLFYSAERVGKQWPAKTRISSF